MVTNIRGGDAQACSGRWGLRWVLSPGISSRQSGSPAIREQAPSSRPSQIQSPMPELLGDLSREILRREAPPVSRPAPIRFVGVAFLKEAITPRGFSVGQDTTGASGVVLRGWVDLRPRISAGVSRRKSAAPSIGLCA